MSITDSIRDYLAAEATISALVSTRIHTHHRVQGQTLPAITITRISGGHTHNLEGSAGTARPRIQIDCWANRPDQAWEMAEAVRLLMQGNVTTMGAHDVDSITLDNEMERYDQPESGRGTGIYWVQQDYFVRYYEPIPAFD